MIDDESFSASNGGPALRALYWGSHPPELFSHEEAYGVIDVLEVMDLAEGRNALNEVCLPDMDHQIWPFVHGEGGSDENLLVHSLRIAQGAGRLLFKVDSRSGYFYSIEYRKNEQL